MNQQHHVNSAAGRPAVYSVSEVAILLGLSRSNTYARVRDGSIPSVRIGGRILVPRKALERLLDVDGVDHAEAGHDLAEPLDSR